MKIAQRLLTLNNTLYRYSAKCGFTVGQLSPRKEMLLSCFAHGIDQIDLPDHVRTSWVTSCEYAFRMINEDECDKLAFGMGFGFDTYLMATFSKGIIDKAQDEDNKKALTCMLGKYAKLSKNLREPIKDNRYMVLG